MTPTATRAVVQGHGSLKPDGGGNQTSSSIELYQHDPTVSAYVAHFRRRVVLDALAHASAACWLRRAEALEAARPRRGDYHGRATSEALRARWDRLTDEARACRAAAKVALLDDEELLDRDHEVDAGRHVVLDAGRHVVPEDRST